MSLSAILGVGVVSFLILYLAFNLEKDHFLLKLMLVIIAFSTLILVPKFGLDNADNCDFVVSNTTLTGNTTSYEYNYFCSTNTNSTPDTFYKSYMLFLVIFVTYIMVYFHKEAIDFIWRLLKK